MISLSFLISQKTSISSLQFEFRIYRTLFENLSAHRVAGEEFDESYDTARAQSGHEEPAAAENPKCNAKYECAREMRFSPTGDNHPRARADTTNF